MKILILWSNWAGYMDAVARELQTTTGCELDVVVTGGSAQAPFEKKNFFNYPCRTFAQSDTAALERLVAEERYDLALVCGWHIPAYRKAAAALKGRTPRVLCMDNQWLSTPRQWLGTIAFRLHLKRLYDWALVPGGRQATFASRLGIPVGRIIEGHYSCDFDTFRAPEGHAATDRSFLFVGRLVEAKGMDVLAGAWRRFAAVPEFADWRLVIAGTGPLTETIEGLPRCERLGFVQPGDLPAVMHRVGAFVLASRYEPWGLVVHEAAAAGLPIIATDRCGAADYYLRNGVNGVRIPAENEDALLAALVEVAKRSPDERAAMGRFSATLARQRTPLNWVAAATRPLM